MKKSLFSRSLAFFLAIVMLACSAVTPAFAAVELDEEEKSRQKIQEMKDLLDAVTYDEYMAGYAQTKFGTDDIVLTVADNYSEEKSEASDSASSQIKIYTADEFNTLLQQEDAGFNKQIAITDSMQPNVKIKTERHNAFNKAYLAELIADSKAHMEQPFDEEKFADIKYDKVIYLPDTGNATFEFSIENAGLYNVEIDYISTEATSNNIEKGIMIDGVFPFKEARSVPFLSYWVDEYDNREEYLKNDPRRDSELSLGYTDSTLDKYGFLKDLTGNEIRPEKAPRPTWTRRFTYDSTGYYNEPLCFYISEGEHTISVSGVTGSMVIGSVRIYKADTPSSYADVLKEYEANNYASAPKGANIKLQAEYAVATSDESIYPLNDRTSAINEPQDPAVVYLNSIGGSKWQSSGQWIEWEFYVAEAGLYEISTRFKQDTMAGMYVTRRLYIDGEVPFAEASEITFNYGSNWQAQQIGASVVDEDGKITINPYKFYFTEGYHTIRMEVVLGDMADILREVSELMSDVNGYYLKILMITGTNPDKYRDYNFSTTIPDVMNGLVEAGDKLYAISAELERVTGQKGEDSVLLDKIARILKLMGEDDDEVAPNLGTLKDNIGNLGSWISSSRSQPLSLDYIQIMPSDHASLPKADANFFESLWHEIKSFFMSFISDYNNLGVLDKDENATEDDVLQVWMTAGRDQAQIIRSMLTSFTADYGIPVNLKLVAAGSLLPATLSETGPDVSIQNAAADCINYAIRGAVEPLNDMAGFEEVTQRFDESALIPLSFLDKTYGIPETQSFQMMFVRLDVFADLDMDVPETWDDLYNLLPKLQSNNLEAGFPVQEAGLSLLMYQRGEPMYKDPLTSEQMEATLTDEAKKGENGFTGADAYKTAGMQINLDSNTSLDCFKQLCELFTMYGFPITYDFANRFRTGEMPIAIQDYSAYNQLTIFAPEISGLWEIRRLPGTPTYEVDEDGDIVYDENGEKVIARDENGQLMINRNSTASVTGVMMMRDAKRREMTEEAWKFMSWWTSADPQSEYGNELVALLGASGQYATANLEALKRQPWSSEVMSELAYQFDNLAVTPQVPGGYIISRYIQFAFLAAYNNNANPVDELLSYIDSINSELTRKRQEFVDFNLPVLDDFKNAEADE